MSTSSFISAVEARGRLPVLSIEEAIAILNVRNEYTDFEKSVLYTHYIIARGDFSGLVDFLNGFDVEERRRIANATLHDTWYGNVLHTCLYWNTGANALNIYRYLVNCAGAIPCLDYYDQYPWAYDADSYIHPLIGDNIADGFRRNITEFAETYVDVQRLFPYAPTTATSAFASAGGFSWSFPAAPPSLISSPAAAAHGAAGDPDPLRATCPLHRPTSLYTRNSNGHYSTYAPSCNGCSTGVRERDEHDLVERINTLSTRLINLLTERYDNETMIEAQNMAEELEDVIIRLNNLSSIITTPQQYAERLLNKYRATLALHTLLMVPLSRTNFNAISLAMAEFNTVWRSGYETIGYETMPIYVAANQRIQPVSN